MKPKYLAILFFALAGFLYNSRPDLAGSVALVGFLIPLGVAFASRLDGNHRGETVRPHRLPYEFIEKHCKWLPVILLVSALGLNLVIYSGYVEIIVFFPAVFLVAFAVFFGISKGLFSKDALTGQIVSSCLGIVFGIIVLGLLNQNFYLGEPLQSLSANKAPHQLTLSFCFNLMLTILLTFSTIFSLHAIFRWKKEKTLDSLLFLPMFRAATISTVLSLILPLFFFFESRIPSDQLPPLMREVFLTSVLYCIVSSALMLFSMFFYRVENQRRKLEKFFLLTIAGPVMLFVSLYCLFPSAFHCISGRFFADVEEYDKSLGELNYALKLEPESSLALSGRAYVYLKSGQKERAVEDLEKLLRLDPERELNYLTWAATTYYDLGKYKRTEELASRCISLAPQSSDAYSVRGVALVKLHRFEAALKDFNKAIELDPGFEYNYVYRGKLYLNLGKCELAIDDFNRAIAIAPDSRIALDYREEAYKLMKQN